MKKFGQAGDTGAGKQSGALKAGSFWKAWSGAGTGFKGITKAAAGSIPREKQERPSGR